MGAAHRRGPTTMVLFAKHLVGCSHTSLTGLDQWTSGAGQHVRWTSCSQDLSVMVLGMLSTILLMASALAHVKALPQAKGRSGQSTATMKIGGRNSTLLVASSAARTTLSQVSSGVIATHSTAWRWPSAAKCNGVSGINVSGSISRGHSLTGTASLRMA